MAAVGWRKVLPTGPRGPGTLVLVGEAPGKDENTKGYCFVGAAGQTLDTYLFRSGISREEVFVTNIARYWPGPGNPNPDWEDIQRDWPELMEEIREIQPPVIVAMGAVAAEQLLSGTDALGLDMSALNGRPIRQTLPEADWEGWVVACFHPAAGIHDPNLAGLGFQGLKAAVRFFVQCQLHTPIQSPVRTSSVLYYSPQALDIITEALEKGRSSGGIGVDTEGWVDDPWCLTFCAEPGESYLIPASEPRLLQHFDSERRRLGTTITLHNSLHDLKVLREMGINLKPGEYEDTIVRAYVCNSETPAGQGLKPLAYKYCGMRMREWDEVIGPHDDRLMTEYLEGAIAEFESGRLEIPVQGRCHPPAKRLRSILKRRGGEKTLRKCWEEFKSKSPEIGEVVEAVVGAPHRIQFKDVPIEDLAPYACDDADATRRLAPVLRAKNRELAVERAYNIDMKVIPILERMTKVGMAVDRHRLASLQTDIEAERARLGGELVELASKVGVKNYNPASGDQTAEVLYRKLGLNTRRMTKSRTREAVDDKALSSIRCHKNPDDPHQTLCRLHHPLAHEFVDLKMEFQEVQKVETAYVVPLWDHIKSDGRIHPNWRHTVVVSGRLATSNPNLLAFPAHSKWGKRLRSCFVAKPGHIYLSCDLSQIELRVLASEAYDTAMMDVFLTGGDLHAKTAMGIFGVSQEDALGDVGRVRTYSKICNFGVAYGLTANGLQGQLATMGVMKSEAECQAIIDGWFRAFPDVRAYFRKTTAETRKYGYVRDMWDRIRWLPGVWSPIERVRSEAERQANNLKIQGGAQGVEKLGMAKWWFEVRPEMPWCEPLLQIHDDLVFELPEDRLDEAKPMIEWALTQAAQDRFAVPITCGTKVGGSWGEFGK